MKATSPATSADKNGTAHGLDPSKARGLDRALWVRSQSARPGLAQAFHPIVGGEGEVRRIQQLGAAGRGALVTVGAGAIIVVAACGQVPAGQSGSAGASAPTGQSASTNLPAAASRAVASADPGGPAVRLSGTSAAAALCTDIPRLTSVVVSRSGGFRDFQVGSILPRGSTVREPGLVRGLATALCGLPEMPRSALTCPAQLGGGSLRFAFAANARPFPPVVVQVSGCRAVIGLGPVRTASSAAFWHIVDQDLGGLGSSPSPNTSGNIP